jgi:hypothetical protein
LKLAAHHAQIWIRGHVRGFDTDARVRGECSAGLATEGYSYLTGEGGRQRGVLQRAARHVVNIAAQIFMTTVGRCFGGDVLCVAHAANGEARRHGAQDSI